MKSRAVLYARVSGDDRMNATSSLQGQLDLCRKLARERGWVVVAELAEDERGASGASWSLPQLNVALDMAREGRYDILVVREIDRLARNLAKQLVIEEDLKRHEVRVEYVIGDYAATPEGELNKQIRAVIAQYEREKINQRMMGGRRRKVEGGSMILHGTSLYGYVPVEVNGKTTLDIDEETAPIVQMIFTLYTERGLGSPAIARELNRLGIPTPSMAKQAKTPQGKRWNQSTVQRIVKNEAYVGRWHYGKRNRKGYNAREGWIAVDIPAIVSQETFTKAQALAKTNNRMASRNVKGDYLLARRCFCGECNAPLRAFTKRGRSNYPYYNCPVPHGDVFYVNRQCGNRTSYRGDYWDARIWQEIRSFLSNPDQLVKGIHQYQDELIQDNAPIQERIYTLERILSEKRTELARLLDLYLSGEFAKGMLLERKQSLEQVVASLESERDALAEQLVATLSAEQVAELQAFSAQIAEGLSAADEDFATRRRLIDYLDVKVTLAIEDGQQVACLQAQFGIRGRLPRDEQTVNDMLSRRPESGREASSHEGELGNCMPNYRRNTDSKLSNWQQPITLLARLVKDDERLGSGLLNAFHARLG